MCVTVALNFVFFSPLIGIDMLLMILRLEWMDFSKLFDFSFKCNSPVSKELVRLSYPVSGYILFLPQILPLR